VLRTIALASLAIAIATAARPHAHIPSQIQRDSIPGTLVTFEMVAVPSGSVTLDTAGGTRTVTVGQFYIGRTEATWDMYDAFTLRIDNRGASTAADAVARPSQPYGAPDYGWGHAGYPVISVARSAAVAFCEWLSAKTGKKYRLPTEAEWLRAADLSSGGATLSPERRAALAWSRGNANNTTHPVGSRTPDAHGIYDLFGNAAEWVTTFDDKLVLRGGSFEDAADSVGPRARALQDDSWNARDPQLPRSRWWLSDAPFAGFRIVRVQ